MDKVLKIHPGDNVAIALQKLNRGEKVTWEGKVITVQNDIPQAHKIALGQIESGQDVVKYGHPIGHAVEKITPGSWVHSHNVKTSLEGESTYEYQPSEDIVKNKSENSKISFKGYERSNGDVGVRNEIWVINTVGCINKSCELIAKTANETFKNEGIDGVFHFPHPFGCSQLGDDLSYTQRLLAGLVNHPNAAGVLVVGLGCENNYIESFKKALGDFDDRRIKFLGAQDVEDEIEEGLDLIEEIVTYANSFQKKDVPISKLKIGLKCGGSDGFSGITANPLVGAFSDKVVAAGGTTILTEVPEMFGAETILMNRAQDTGVFKNTIKLINDFKDYFVSHGQPIYENPSPGNKDGGITTLEEKSLGCVQKGGRGEVVDIVEYAGKVTKPGLNLLQGPGNDLVSVTNLAASGAQIVLFTTGRGTPFGGPVPTVKISTNSQLYNQKKRWIDFNAGELAEGKSFDELSGDLFDYVLSLASGETRTNNEKYDFREIAIFKDGVTL